MDTRRFLLLFTLLAALVAAAPALHADDAPAPRKRGKAPAADEDFVAQLTPQELSFLRERIKGWDAMEARKKQMIARNVLRIRTMSADQRKRFEERLKHMRERGRGLGDGPHGVMLVNRALALAARERLGRDFERSLRRRDISDHVFEMSFARAFWERVAASAFTDAEPPDPQTLPADLAGRQRGRFAKAYAAWKAESDAGRREPLRRRLGFAWNALRAEQLRHDVARSGPKEGEAYVQAVAQRVQQTWPKELDAALADPQALLQSAEDEEVRRSLRRLLRRDGALKREESVLLVRLVERWAGGQDGAADTSAADALVLRLLREELELPAETLAAMPPREQVEARAEWLRSLFARHGGMRGRGPRGQGGEHRRGPGGRRAGPLKRPEDLSDEDWAAVQAAVRKAFMERTWPPTRPESVDEATWQKVMDALPKRRGR